jgi:PIN domain nuclease of toxin-antitoxin system
LTLLDTNAVLWLTRGHPRGRPVARLSGRVYVSPATVLELQLLVESGRLRFRSGADVAALADNPRWLLDDPPSRAWFARAIEVGWTRDPFDRLLIAHARLRGWRLATGDAAILRHLEPAERLEL